MSLAICVARLKHERRGIQKHKQNTRTHLAADCTLGYERKQLGQAGRGKADVRDGRLLLLEMRHDVAHDPVGGNLGVCTSCNNAVVIGNDVAAVSQHQCVLRRNALSAARRERSKQRA